MPIRKWNNPDADGNADMVWDALDGLLDDNARKKIIQGQKKMKVARNVHRRGARINIRAKGICMRCKGNFRLMDSGYCSSCNSYLIGLKNKKQRESMV